MYVQEIYMLSSLASIFFTADFIVSSFSSLARIALELLPDLVT